MFQTVNENLDRTQITNRHEVPDDFVDIEKSLIKTKKSILDSKILVESGNKYFELEGFDSKELGIEKKKCLTKLDTLEDIAQETMSVAKDIISKKIPVGGANYKLAELYFYRGSNPDKYKNIFHYMDDDRKKQTQTAVKFSFLKNQIYEERFNVLMDYFNKLSSEIEKIDSEKANEFRKQNLDELKKDYQKIQDEMMMELSQFLTESINIEADNAIK